MNERGAIHRELLLTLAAEIRQTLVWLGQEEESPARQTVLQRIRTLREAAAAARLAEVERVLAELEENTLSSANESRDGSDLLETILSRLSDLLVELAHPVQKQELLWAERLARIQSSLEKLSQRIDVSSSHLGQLSLLVDTVVTTPEEDRIELLAQLGRELRSTVDELRSWRRNLQSVSGTLQQTARALARELSAVHRVPLAPSLARLRERARRFGHAHGRPVSLHFQCSRLEVGVRQFDPLLRVLENLLEDILHGGLEDPRARRDAGKSTVANIRITARLEDGLIRIQLEDDGPENRPIPVLDEAAESDLNSLRARLLERATSGPGRCLELTLPPLHSSLEALPFETRTGQFLVPLGVIDRIRGEHGECEADVCLITLGAADSASDPPVGPGGLICTMGKWRGWLPGRVLGPAIRVNPMPPNESDPAWVLGRAGRERQDLPLLNPLPFVPRGAGAIEIYPGPDDPRYTECPDGGRT